jgi:hypothetical protein
MGRSVVEATNACRILRTRGDIMRLRRLLAAVRLFAVEGLCAADLEAFDEAVLEEELEADFLCAAEGAFFVTGFSAAVLFAGALCAEDAGPEPCSV